MARTSMITIRVDEAEHALFKGAAQAVGISISEYARDAMLARMALEQAPVPVEPRVVRREGVAAKAPPPPPQVTGTTHSPAMIIHEVSSVIKSPADVPGAVRRVASAEEARAFAPYSKQQQTGRGTPTRLRKAKAEPVASCRHGLLRCKVCGTG